MQDSDSSTGPSSQSAGPLAGYRVLEFGSFVAGPFAAQMLADLGADVIKIEPPTGDPWRSHMTFAPYESRVFIALNRGKRSICIDLKQPEGVEVCHALVRSADAVLSNNRPDTAAKLKFDHETLMGVNPSLVYCDITAYGASGPKKDEPGFDLITQGYTGAMATEGKVVRGHPVPVRSSSFIDYSTGYATVNAVLAGLLARERTGEGQLASTSLLGNAIAMQSLSVIRVERALSAAQVWVDGERKELVERGASVRRTASGILKGVDRANLRMLLPCLPNEGRRVRPRHASGAAQDPAAQVSRTNRPTDRGPGYDEATTRSTPEAVALAEELVEQIEAEFAKRTTAEWITELRERDIPCEPVRFAEEIVNDEQALANDYVVEMEHPAGGRYRAAGPVVDFKSGNPPLRPSPMLGQHSREILEELGPGRLPDRTAAGRWRRELMRPGRAPD